ncbi:ATP synthase subunit e [Yarrowia sp. B02]|nr:ATP synthase subunit e [Yarrowia sp. B02]
MSATLNVLRWSALGAGVVYGFVHNRTLYSEAEKKVADAKYKKQEKLIEQAKAEWARLHPAPAAAAGGAELDITSDKFDIDAYLKQAFPEKA